MKQSEARIQSIFLEQPKEYSFLTSTYPEEQLQSKSSDANSAVYTNESTTLTSLSFKNVFTEYVNYTKDLESAFEVDRHSFFHFPIFPSVFPLGIFSQISSLSVDYATVQRQIQSQQNNKSKSSSRLTTSQLIDVLLSQTKDKMTSFRQELDTDLNQVRSCLALILLVYFLYLIS